MDMKNNKTTCPNDIPIEVCQRSKVAQADLFVFLQNVWQSEVVTKNLVLSVFVMIHKKGIKDDCSNYRPTTYRFVESLV